MELISKKIFYASSSSVYGENTNFPLQEKEILNPKNVYGITKKLNEVIAEDYYKKYDIKVVGLRFFTVYGEWGRPDMFFQQQKNRTFQKHDTKEKKEGISQPGHVW